MRTDNYDYTGGNCADSEVKCCRGSSCFGLGVFAKGGAEALDAL